MGRTLDVTFLTACLEAVDDGFVALLQFIKLMFSEALDPLIHDLVRTDDRLDSDASDVLHLGLQLGELLLGGHGVPDPFGGR